MRKKIAQNISDEVGERAKYMNAEKIAQNISNEVGERAKYMNAEKNSPKHKQ